MLRAVLDTNVLISARRSRSGASNALLAGVAAGRFQMLVSVPLFLEYEAVLTRPALLQALRIDRDGVVGALDYLAKFVEPVRLEYLWRPQLNDPADEMVLETAINGRADHLVTFNDRDFRAAGRFGIRLATPAAFLELMK